MESNIRVNAELVREVAREQIGIAVDYDEAGVRWLDKYIDEQRIAASDEVKNRLPSTLGSFLGECIRHTYGGLWTQDTDTGNWAVKINDKLSAFPFTKVQKQMAGGEGDSVLGLFTAIAGLLTVAPLTAENRNQQVSAPWWRFWRRDVP